MYWVATRDIHVGTTAITRFSSQVKINNTTVQRTWCMSYTRWSIKISGNATVDVYFTVWQLVDRQFSCSLIDKNCEGISPDTDLLCSFKKKIVKHTFDARTHVLRTSGGTHWVSMLRSRIRPRSTFVAHVSRALATAAALRGRNTELGRSIDPTGPMSETWDVPRPSRAQRRIHSRLATSSAALTG